MVAGGDHVEAGVPRQPHLFDDLAEPDHRVVRARMLRHHENPELHRTSPDIGLTAVRLRDGRGVYPRAARSADPGAAFSG